MSRESGTCRFCKLVARSRLPAQTFSRASSGFPFVPVPGRGALYGACAGARGCGRAWGCGAQAEAGRFSRLARRLAR
eukprot:2715970-Alexandrium_andersonii.AAC.1